MTTTALLVGVLLLGTDQRLATATRAVVKPADALADDQPVAACVAARLTAATALENVAETDAEVTVTIYDASLGKHPKAKATVSLPDGTVLWQGGSKTRGFNLINRDMTCVLADDILSNLRNARRKARDANGSR